MPSYIIAYKGGKSFETPEETAAHRAKFMAWIGGLGDAIVNPGTPLGMSKTVSLGGVSDADGPNRLTGFSTVTADSIEAAVDMAKTCPFLDIGTLEVAEMMEMK